MGTANTTDTCCNRYSRYSGCDRGMQGRPLRRSQSDGPLLVLCI